MGLPFITSAHAKKRDQLVAIDLGACTTKAVHLQRRGDSFGLLNYAVLDTPQSEKALTTEALTEHFREVSRAVGGRTKYVTLALGVHDTVFKQVDVPLMPLPDVRLMLKFNSKSYLQQDLPDHVYDCQYLPGKPGETLRPNAGQKQKALVGAARKPLIDECHAAFKAAGLFPDQIVPGIIGPLNAFELAEPESFRNEVVALVELGFKNTTITILNAGEILLNRVVNLGGDRLTSGLADSLGITYQEAENIKIGMPSEVMQNLEPLIHPLGRELRASIDFFENQHDKPVTKIYLSGGPARSDLMVQTLQTELMVPCEVWNPAKRCHRSLPPEKAGEFDSIASQFTVAIGAAAASF